MKEAKKWADKNNYLFTYNNNGTIYYFANKPSQTGKDWTVGLTPAQKKSVARSK